MCGVHAFSRDGRFRVIVAIASRTSYRIFSYDIGYLARRPS